MPYLKKTRKHRVKRDKKRCRQTNARKSYKNRTREYITRKHRTRKHKHKHSVAQCLLLQVQC